MNLTNIREEIDNGVFLNFIETDKFKSNLISVHIIRPLSRDEVTMNALIPPVLKRGTQRYKRTLEIERQLEELYGSSLSVGVGKKGEKQILSFSIEGPNRDFVQMDDIFKQKLDILNEVIRFPLVDNGAFVKSYVEQEKKNLRKRIEGRINDKKQFAIDRCIEEMCKNEAFSLYRHGYIEDIDSIDSESLYEHYRKLLKTSLIEISVVGHIDQKNVLNNVKEIFKFDRGNIDELSRENVIKEINTKKKINDEMDVNQGKLTLGFRTNIPYEDELYEPLLIGNNILGGGPDSKLFKNVREKESLAYYVYTKSYKFKSIMLVAAGIEFEKYEKALEIIKDQVNEIKKGNFTEKDIEQSKKSMITSIRSMSDSIYSVSDFYVSKALSKDDRNMEDFIENIEKATKNEIIESMSKLNLDTIYFLKNKAD